MSFFDLTVKNEIVLSQPFTLNIQLNTFIKHIISQNDDILSNIFPTQLYEEQALKNKYFYKEYTPNKSDKKIMNYNKYKFIGLSFKKEKFIEFFQNEMQKELNLLFYEIEYILYYFNLNKSISLEDLKIIQRDNTNNSYYYKKILKNMIHCFNKCKLNDNEIVERLNELNKIKSHINQRAIKANNNDTNFVNIKFILDLWYNFEKAFVTDKIGNIGINKNTYKYIPKIKKAYGNINIGDFVKLVKQIIKFGNIIYNKLFDNLNYAYLILGKCNSFTFLLSFNYKKNIILSDNNKMNNKDYSDIINLAKKTNSKIDLFKTIFKFLNLNTYFNIDNKFNNIINIPSNHKVSKTIYCNFDINKKDLNKLFNYGNSDLIKNIRFVFNFYTSFISRYKILNSDSQINEINNILNYNKYHIKENDKTYQMAIPYGEMENLHKNDNNVLFIEGDTLVFGFICPINLILDNYKKNQKNEIFNHQYRYNSQMEFNAALSSNIYLQATIFNNIIFRNKVSRIDNYKCPIHRLIYINNLINYYNNAIVMYSSNSIYESEDKNFIYFKIINHSHLHEEETDTELLFKNLWQEANIITGRIYSFIGIIITLIGTIFAIYVYYTNNNPNNILINNFWIVLAILFGAIALYLGFVHITKSNK